MEDVWVVWGAVWLTLIADGASRPPPPANGFCFVAARSGTDRTVFQSLTEIKPNSPWHCKYYCWQQGHTHASVEYGQYCGCASLTDFEILVDNPSAECTSVCLDNACMICGGLYVANFYTVEDIVPYPPDDVCTPATTTGVTTAATTLPPTTLLSLLPTTIPSTLPAATTTLPGTTTNLVSTTQLITTTATTDLSNPTSAIPTTTTDVPTNPSDVPSTTTALSTTTGISTVTPVTDVTTITDVLSSTTYVPTSSLAPGTSTPTSITPTAAPTDFTTSTSPTTLTPSASTITSTTGNDNGNGNGNNGNGGNKSNGSDSTSSTTDGNETLATTGMYICMLSTSLCASPVTIKKKH
ncbi:hypothetical protein O3P69_004100 [Scylla paramamosain]|uniref:WSC domain-containing protein n=1 Tax=Scylla paramamosain TaxID=85552 RepID=A0AAW0UIH4_SCYPA